uniref:H(+)-exporting diphosphatase n=2 Tax=Bursaphelenchus xylophilus TaxID=6326 RepID=A0A1I7RW89_BURXY
MDTLPIVCVVMFFGAVHTAVTIAYTCSNRQSGQNADEFEKIVENENSKLCNLRAIVESTILLSLGALFTLARYTDLFPCPGIYENIFFAFMFGLAGINDHIVDIGNCKSSKDDAQIVQII